jgi:para-nitrobenzyl esterase
MIVRWYQIRKIRVRYGDGSQGFLYDDMYTSEEIEEFNKQNRQIKGEYDTKLAVKTKTGVYVGYKEKKGVVYREIPYAKPPVGKLRWKAPEPLPASDEVFEAKYFGASAIQVEHKGSILKIHRQSEDCLTLNVCVGKKDNNDKKPVVVLFHHGDFSYGGSADPLMYLEKIADTYSDFIGVSFNYRLGIFGFIDFSEVPGGENYPDALNLGLLDQIAALEWVKENISAFGGDPGNITVMGFESGAISISLLAACERAKGLFQKAFIFFGSPDFSYLTPEAARAFAQKLLEETGAKSMDELQRL